MYNGRATIALLGPQTETMAPEAAQLARNTGFEVASKGYVLAAIPGSGAGNLAIEGAEKAGGQVLLFTDSESPAKETKSTSLIPTQGPLNRMQAILRVSDALIILPGDLNALAAMLQVWSYGTTKRGPYRQVVLIGPEWPAIIKALAEAASLDDPAQSMVTYANTAQEAVEAMRYYIHPTDS